MRRFCGVQLKGSASKRALSPLLRTLTCWRLEHLRHPLLRSAVLRGEHARAHLLCGEWLRREGRRMDAREQLRTAHRMFTAMGAQAFAERTRRELLATGETMRKRTVDTRYDLTAQERQIARLAREGLSNPEISTQLFISPRTVEWHLRKVFSKLGIRSRRQLRAALSEDGRLIASA
jgi:DNA-binding CsgD family transcriptional regulator